MTTLPQTADVQTALATRVSAIEPSLGRDALAAAFLDAVGLAEQLATYARDMKTEARAALYEWMQHHGPVVIGPKRYRIGAKTKYTIRVTKLEAFVALLKAAEGDEAAFAACLASDGLLPSKCRTVLGDTFGDVFVTEVEQVVAVGELTKADKAAQVIEIDERYVR